MARRNEATKGSKKVGRSPDGAATGNVEPRERATLNLGRAGD